jgi:hypothetical protein
VSDDRDAVAEESQTVQPSLNERCRDLLGELRLASPDDPVDAVPLSGGVASDIAMVRVNGRRLCVKFALPKLKVEADWFAPVQRNAAEYAWLEFAARTAPEGAVRLHGRSERLHGFAMEFLDGEDTYLWKSELLREAPDKGEAVKVGDLLGRIHAASAREDFITAPFHNWDDFQALRIEPYLLHTASKHRDIAGDLERMAGWLYRSRQVLVHGDVSPKNILIRAGEPILLDAECATMGDASFDPSFCLNHLVLKAIHLPGSRQRHLSNAIEFWKAYEPHVAWEATTATESRICRLLPALMLGRVDGKSPVEYLDDAERGLVRRIARQFIQSPAVRLDDLIDGVSARLKETTA